MTAKKIDKDLPLIQDIRLLGRILGDVIREQEGVAAFDLIEQVRKLSVAFRRDADHEADKALKKLLKGLSADQTVSVIRAFTYFSHLANLAEDRHHIRRRTIRERAGDTQEGSIEVALSRLRWAGIAPRTVAQTLAGKPTAVSYGPMPITVKTPACPLVVSPAPQGCEGIWQVEGQGSDLKVLCLDADGKLLGYALTEELPCEHGMPVTFYNDHYDLLLSQDFLFARKISPEAVELKARLGDLYAAAGARFSISGEGRRLHGFLTGRGRIGRRFAPRFDGTFRYDLDTDTAPELIRFSKPPLEIALTGRGLSLRLIGVHAKSKAPHGAETREEIMRLSIENRRKQLAQCIWLRARVEEHLARGDRLLVMGDFNDGPGLDEFEKLFGRSGVEIVMGCDKSSPFRLREPHAELALQSKVGISPTTARFYLKPQRRYFEALLDFVMVSPNLAARMPDWRIWHPFNDPGVMAVPELREALLQASDHFPVTIDIPTDPPATRRPPGDM